MDSSQIVVKSLKCVRYLVDEKIADLLEQNDDSGRSVVVLGTRPDQADNVHHRSNVLLDLIEFGLLNVLDVRSQRLQIQVDVLRLMKGCRNIIKNRTDQLSSLLVIGGLEA